jgi:hypothetical protein
MGPKTPEQFAAGLCICRWERLHGRQIWVRSLS